MIKDIQHLSYEDMLKKLSFHSLVKRRLKCTKVLNNLENIDEEILFNRSSTTNLRVHNFKLFKKLFQEAVS